MKQALILTVLWLLSSLATAHHSNAEYDRATLVELEGVIARVIWRNPHVGLELDVTAPDGSVTRWTMGAADLASTRRRGVPAGTFAEGMQVHVAGFASSRRPANMLVTNVLLPDGREILLTGFSEPRWQEATLGGGNWVAAAEVGEAGSRDLFRVWTLDRTRRPDFAENPPLVPPARRAWQAYQDSDDPALACAMLGMPRVVTATGPHPIAFARQDDDILFLGEYFDTRRVIHMDPNGAPAIIGGSPLGYSKGHWEGETLVVDTAFVSYPYFDINGLAGIPQSPAASMTERYYLSEDGTELHMDFAYRDPQTFTQALEIPDYAVWKWRPDIEILPYQCETD